MNYADILSYDASTGDLKLKIDKLRTKAGEIATTQGGRGYLKFEWKGEKQYAHRLAWLLHYGEWPARNQAERKYFGEFRHCALGN